MTNTPIDTNDPAAVLNAAADLLEHDGWIQGELWAGKRRGEDYRPGTPCCANGAIAAVLVPADPYLGSAVFHSSHAILAKEIGRMVSTWNDQTGQTAENVIATMRAAAQKAATDNVVNNVVETMLRRQLDGTGN